MRISFRPGALALLAAVPMAACEQAIPTEPEAPPAILSQASAMPVPEGGEGCTPGYWKQEQHFDSWPAPYTPDMPFDAVFDDAFPGMTLVEVAAQGGGGINALGRHTVAALLNSASEGVDYDLTVWDVISAFDAAYQFGDYNGLKGILEGYNEQGCLLD